MLDLMTSLAKSLPILMSIVIAVPVFVVNEQETGRSTPLTRWLEVLSIVDGRTTTGPLPIPFAASSSKAFVFGGEPPVVTSERTSARRSDLLDVSLAPSK
jgi:hypothetical protein